MNESSTTTCQKCQRPLHTACADDPISNTNSYKCWVSCPQVAQRKRKLQHRGKLPMEKNKKIRKPPPSYGESSTLHDHHHHD
mmetsp:Transcript_23384/g.26629  ORF Transcript_23384/g.26629 Transcript_23384/m.26629 type:complete len:82 (+) Transcript_23384:140-385(+)